MAETLNKLVVGADGKAELIPLTKAELAQRAADEKEHLAKINAPPPTAEEKLARLGLTVAELKVLLG